MSLKCPQSFFYFNYKKYVPSSLSLIHSNYLYICYSVNSIKTRLCKSLLNTCSSAHSESLILSISFIRPPNKIFGKCAFRTTCSPISMLHIQEIKIIFCNITFDLMAIFFCLISQCKKKSKKISNNLMNTCLFKFLEAFLLLCCYCFG